MNGAMPIAADDRPQTKAQTSALVRRSVALMGSNIEMVLLD